MKPSSILGASIRSAIVEKDGTASRGFMKVLQDFDLRVNNATNAKGELTGTAAPGAVIVSTDNIEDGTGHPLAGGKAAYTALVTSTRSGGQVLTWNGSDWVPANLPAPPVVVNRIIAGTNITITPAGGTGDVTVNAAGAAGSILTATAGIVVAPGGGSTSQFVPIAGATNAAAFVQQLQAPGLPFTGASTGFVLSITNFSMSFVAGGVTLNVTTTPPGGCSFTAGTYQVNIKAIL